MGCRGRGGGGGAAEARAVSVTMRPSSMPICRGIRAAMAWSWVTTMIVVPAAFSSSSRPRMDWPVAWSRLPVGSSASTIAGDPASARAMATRCRSPPDSCVGRDLSLWPSPTRSSAAAASWRRSAAGYPAYSRASATLANALWCSARKNCWNTNPMLAARSPASCRSSSPATSRPVTRTRPADGRSRVPARCSSVVLPDPDGPTTATSSPAATSRLTPSSAVTGGEPG